MIITRHFIIIYFDFKTFFIILVCKKFLKKVATLPTQKINKKKHVNESDRVQNICSNFININIGMNSENRENASETLTK